MLVKLSHSLNVFAISNQSRSSALNIDDKPLENYQTIVDLFQLEIIALIF